MFKELLIKLGKYLKNKKIPYMIIGGQAVILYGEPRLTRDIDITLGWGKEGLEDILSLCKKISLKPLPENTEDFVAKMMVLPTLEEKTGIRVDFIFSYTPYEKEAIGRAKKILLDDVEVNFAAVEDVIIHKIFAHRPRDIEDIKNIMLKKPAIDKDYIKRWLSEFDRSMPEEHLLEVFQKLLVETGSERPFRPE
jgi:predicted nucleotidyltransferase